jgi:hypothetical protein
MFGIKGRCKIRNVMCGMNKGAVFFERLLLLCFGFEWYSGRDEG